MRRQIPRTARRIAFIAAAIGILTLPAAATANTVVNRNADTITLTGDGNPDRILIGADIIAGVPVYTFESDPSATSPTLVTAGAPCFKPDSRVACPQQGVTGVVANLNGAADVIRFSSDPADAAATALDATFNGGDGNDVLVSAGGNDSLDGGAGDDQLQGGAGADSLVGGSGADLVSYEEHPDGVTVTLDGQANDGGTLADGSSEGDNVDASIERVVGGPGNDTLVGDASANRLEGGAGNDTLDGGAGADQFAGGTGIDTVTYAGRTAAVGVTVDGLANDGAAGERDAIELDVERFVGGSAGDTFTVPDDQAGRGRTFDGGPGFDTTSYAAVSRALTITLDGAANDGPLGAAKDDVRTEAARGGAGDDMLTGDAGANLLDGGAGADRIDGAGGADRIVAGAGDDVVLARDGIADDVACGDGADSVTADALDSVDAACETVERPAVENPPPAEQTPPATGGEPSATEPAPAKGDGGGEPAVTAADTSGPGEPAPDATSGSSVPAPRGDTSAPRLLFPRIARFDRRGRARVRALCASKSACTGALTIVLGRRVIARQRFAIAAGKRQPFALQLNKAGRALLARRRSLRVSIVGTARDSSGNVGTFRRTIVLAPVKRKAPKRRA